MDRGDYITSWLATEDDDDVYPWKQAILITYGEGGYHKTEWMLRREDIIERNKVSGITEEDRIKAEGLAIQLSVKEETEWAKAKKEYDQHESLKFIHSILSGIRRKRRRTINDAEWDKAIKSLNRIQKDLEEREVINADDKATG
jgi:hypothetical protein